MIDWSKSNHAIAKETGHSRTTIIKWRKLMGIAAANDNHGYEWGSEIEQWVHNTLLPQSIHVAANDRHAPYDLLDPCFGRIDVKSSSLETSHGKKRYAFYLNRMDEHKCDYYIAVGLDDSRKPNLIYFIPSSHINIPIKLLRIYQSDESWRNYCVPDSTLYMEGV